MQYSPKQFSDYRRAHKQKGSRCGQMWRVVLFRSINTWYIDKYVPVYSKSGRRVARIENDSPLKITCSFAQIGCSIALAAQCAAQAQKLQHVPAASNRGDVM